VAETIFPNHLSPPAVSAKKFVSLLSVPKGNEPSEVVAGIKPLSNRPGTTASVSPMGVAAALGISPTTGDRRWAYARAWLWPAMASGAQV
jgi:hypothetical protein